MNGIKHIQYTKIKLFITVLKNIKSSIKDKDDFQRNSQASFGGKVYEHDLGVTYTKG